MLGTRTGGAGDKDEAENCTWLKINTEHLHFEPSEENG
jgi:hypothetical protein